MVPYDYPSFIGITFTNTQLQDIFQKDDEVRRLRKTIAKREGEAQQWRDRLEEVEGALREALGDVTGTKENLLEVSI